MDQTWKEAQVEEGHLTILNRVIKDRRALRNVTQMKTEILFEILHLDIWLIAIGNAVIHKAPGKEDIEHILWLVSPCEWKLCLFKKLFCKVILLCFYYQNNLNICTVWEQVHLYYRDN